MRKLLLATMMSVFISGCGSSEDESKYSEIVEQFAKSLDWDIDEINKLCNTLVCDYDENGREVVENQDYLADMDLHFYIRDGYSNISGTFSNQIIGIQEQAYVTVNYENIDLKLAAQVEMNEYVTADWQPTDVQLIEMSHSSVDFTVASYYCYRDSIEAEVSCIEKSLTIHSPAANVLGRILLNRN